MSPIYKAIETQRYCLVAMLFVATISASCKKLIEIKPPINAEIGSQIYTSDASAAAVLTGIYTNMSSGQFAGTFTGINSISITAGLSSDELSLIEDNGVNNLLAQYYTNSLNSSLTLPSWHLYQPIFISNAAIEGLTSSNSLTPAVKDQLLGEAKFVRALSFFYLTNLFGEVPLTLTSDYKTNISLPRAPKKAVYEQIIKDLREAQALLKEDFLKSDASTAYSRGSEERVRPTKWAATALLSRVYLFTNDWTNAEIEASKVINNTTQFSLVSNLNSVFRKNSKEAIWQLQPSISDENTKDGLVFILTPDGPNPFSKPVYLSNFMLSKFELGDSRKSSWTDSIAIDGKVYHYPFKYKVGMLGQPVTEYYAVLRLAELYLIRAEARIETGNIQGGIEDLNILRTRARGINPGDLPDLNYIGFSKSDALKAVVQERQVELFSEWGHRWLDLKRIKGFIDPSTFLSNEIMPSICIVKGGVWHPNWALYPLPNDDILRNPNLSPNNPGY